MKTGSMANAHYPASACSRAPAAVVQEVKSRAPRTGSAFRKTGSIPRRPQGLGQNIIKTE